MLIITCQLQLWNKSMLNCQNRALQSPFFTVIFHSTAPVMAKGFDLAVLRSFRDLIVSAEPELKKPLGKSFPP